MGVDEPIAERHAVRVRVLVVDDEPGVRSALERALALEHHDVLLAGDGPDALDVLATRHVDMVVLDDRCPASTGSRCAGACARRAIARRCRR